MPEYLDNAARYLILAMGVAIPFSTPAVSITSGLILLFWMAAATNSENLRQKLHRIATNPIAVTALLVWGVIGLNMLHGPQSWHDAIEMWWKYRKLLIIAIIITLLQDAEWRRRAEYAFIGTMLVTLVLRYGYAIDWWRSGGIGPYAPHNISGHITHNIFMAFTAYWLLQRMWQCRDTLTQWQYRAHSVVILFAVGDVLFLTPGRTGWLVLAALTILALAERWKWRGLLAALLVVSAISTASYQFSSTFNAHLHEAVSDVDKYKSGNVETSFGLRLEFYRHSLEILSAHPFLGAGTGSFKGEYEKRVTKQETLTANPHNEYFAIGTQLGLVGIGFFLFMLWQQWRLAAGLPKRAGVVAKGVVITIVTGSVLNSLLFDFHEGHFYAYLIGTLYASLGREGAARKCGNEGLGVRA